eukprot:1132556-Prorocentrum_lima.AAC.1
MNEKRKHPELVRTRKWWMQHYLKLKDLLHKENIHQTIQGASQKGTAQTGQTKARLAQPMEGTPDWNKMTK